MADHALRAAMAERAARAGGVVALERFRESNAVETKANKNDLVTESDRDAQRQVIATVSQEFPRATLVCEEEAGPPGVVDGIDVVASMPETGRAWVVDPIDGTSNYVRGIRFWGTSVAATIDREPVGVATYLPAEDDLYAAGPESITLNGASIRVSDRSDPETFAVGLLGWWPTERAGEFGRLAGALADRFGDTRRFGCMQGALALVASGGLEAAVMPHTPHPWDALAGVHLVRRAGGTATDLAGDPWTVGATGLVVSNDTAHDRLLATTREAAGFEPAD